MKALVSLFLFLSVPAHAQQIQDDQISNNITAGQLNANGANCPSGQYPLGVDATGAVEDCTVAGAGGSEGTTVSDTTTVNLTLTGTDIEADVIESALTITESQISDLSHTVDTDTNLDLAGVQALGFVTGAHTINTDTQLTESQVDTFVSNNGYSTGSHTVDTVLDEATVDGYANNNGYSVGAHTVDTNTQNTQTDIEAFGFVTGSHTVDTNTQLSDAQVATAATNEGFVTGPHTIDTNTQNSQADIEAFGFVTGAHTADTVLNEATVDSYANNNGYSVGAHTVDTNTQLSQEEVEDFVSGVIVAGTDITATYDDGAGTLTIASTASGGGGTDTNASTICAGSTEVLYGDGTCGVPSGGGGGSTITGETFNVSGRFLLDPGEINGWGNRGTTNDTHTQDLGNVGTTSITSLASGRVFPYDIAIQRFRCWHWNSNVAAQAWGWVMIKSVKTEDSNTTSETFILDESTVRGGNVSNGAGLRDYLDNEPHLTDIDLSANANNVLTAGTLLVMGVGAPTAVTTNYYVGALGCYVEYDRI